MWQRQQIIGIKHSSFGASKLFGSNIHTSGADHAANTDYLERVREAVSAEIYDQVLEMLNVNDPLLL